MSGFVERPRSARLVRIFIPTLAVCSVLAFGFGWWVVSGVRVTAATTDLRIRTLAWATLGYATEFGQFPASEAELRAFGAGPESLAIVPAAAEAWPVRRTEALHGEAPAPLEECFHAIVVVWGEHRGMPPYLKPDGLPTLHGTAHDVNAWLKAFADRQK